MAKELMEIGGFITEGAEIVNHDNSLSGNGTVDSPLGVVPGYNETVLWSGNNATTLNLSEPATSFNTVKVYYGNSASVANNVINGCYEFTPLGNYVGIHSCFVGNSANKSTYTVHTIWSGINTNTWSRIYYAYKNMASSGWNTDSNWQNIIKVVGCNRISGSNT